QGRLALRRYWTSSAPRILAALTPSGAWPDLRSLGMVERERRSGSKGTLETRYYLASLPGAVAPFAHAVRGHWGVENRLHWILALAFREDERRVRVGHGAHHLASLRHVALNLLHQERTAKVGIKAKRLMAGWDARYRLTVLTACGAIALPHRPLP